MKSIDFSRSDRLSDQIRLEISLILRDEVNDPRLNGLTIVKVELSKDINKAFIYFSSYNSFSNVSIEDVMLGLDRATGFIRSFLSKRLEIKRVPKLIFEREKPEQLL